ncbi:PLP-dependent aminotransferase family protein [Salipiger sp. P9]|uniref:aminotransferase-like domain-containing protein n=1 Tax=Salipiger pentaromativorans TaxID=2943193 RepID=UPI0021576075|nr:PLP-dependent aminotransferase family protein [Salipiger pentaromativorans]MCR8551204.1 PLP-dependent aminotransferase family protein [Salipiger pentaromativorans]
MASPRYLQLADSLASAIRSGKLAPGTRLPPHRAFAEKLGIALATATRVYGELERRGLVVGETGRGTFVRDPGVPPALGVRQTATDGLVDLVFNMPGEASDADLLRDGLRRLATTGDLEAMLRYQPHGGRMHERRIIAGDLARSVGAVDPDRLLVTSGGQHALAIIALGVFARGDAIAADTLTYPGFKSVAAMQGLDLVAVEGGQGVMDPDALDRQCRSRRIRAVYLMPTVHNPLGTVMDEATRLRLVDVARRHDLWLIEDAAYAFLEPSPPPSLAQLAPERTFHVGGYSKSIATGLRLGYVIVPECHRDGLLDVIRATTWNAPALISALVTGWIEDGTLRTLEENRRRDGADRQRLCRHALRGHPVVAHRNAGFAWLPLEGGARAEPIVTRLMGEGLLVSGAEPFATSAAVPQALRLAFGGVPKADLGDCLRRVGEAIGAPEGTG